MPKTKKLTSKKKVSLELLHHRFGHISTRSLMAGDTESVCKDIEFRINPDSFCTPCKIYSIKKRLDLKMHWKKKSPFKWVFLGIIPATAPKGLTCETNFSNYL